MLSFKLGNTTVHLWPLIVVLLVAVLGVIIRAVWLSNLNKKMIELCRAGKYNQSISIAAKQLNYYQRVIKLSKNGHTKSIMDILHLYLAISYFGLSNDNLFIQNISLVDENNSEKHFWLALFYLLKNNLNEFQQHYDILSSKEISADYLSYLTALKKHQEGNDSEARDALSALYSKLNFSLLKDISKRIIEQQN